MQDIPDPDFIDKEIPLLDIPHTIVINDNNVNNE